MLPPTTHSQGCSLEFVVTSVCRPTESQFLAIPCLSFQTSNIMLPPFTPTDDLQHQIQLFFFNYTKILIMPGLQCPHII